MSVPNIVELEHGTAQYGVRLEGGQEEGEGQGGGIVGRVEGHHHVADRRVKQARRKSRKKTTVPKNQPSILEFLKMKAAKFTLENTNARQMGVGGPKDFKRKSVQVEGPDAKVKVSRMEGD